MLKLLELMLVISVALLEKVLLPFLLNIISLKVLLLLRPPSIALLRVILLVLLEQAPLDLNSTSPLLEVLELLPSLLVILLLVTSNSPSLLIK